MQTRHPNPSIKAILALVLLVLLGAVCIAAGQWQLRRAHAREAVQAAQQAGRQAPPLTLDARQRSGPDWHPAQARGQWLNQYTVLIDNRNLDGQPGFWVATPLALQAQASRVGTGSRGNRQSTALLVLRGWVARPLPPATLPTVEAASGPVQVRGTLLAQVPRLFDLGSITGHPDDQLPKPFPPATTSQPSTPQSAASQPGTHQSSPPQAATPSPAAAQSAERLPRVQNLSLDTLAAASGLDLLPVVLEQAPTQDAGLIQRWPGPSLNASQNYNYALQWFSFAAIALGAAAITLWRVLRRRRNPSLSTPKAQP
ncbi:SURF1 family protein [Castellaniella caeni]|uniref:SURF1 family protein n=1 Tax=Castellaniella caeni TaxID=266123 RepID=UPI000829C28B|nr:SURF1 family protein [Castellaniella caeni]